MAKIICLDLRSLQIGHENRGIGMVIKGILENLHDDNNKYLFYIFEHSDPIRDLEIKATVKYQLVKTPQLHNEIKKISDLCDSFRLQFHRFSNLKKYKPDVFVQFDFKLGLPHWRNIKKYVYAYDLIPLIMKNDYIPSATFAVSRAVGKRAKLKAFLRAIYYEIKYHFFYRIYKKDNFIISISKATTNSFSELLNIKKNKIITIPLAPTVIGAPSPKNSKLIKKPYIFYIGGTDRRKRIDHLVYAFNIVRSRGYDLRLVLAGNEFKDSKTIPDDRTRDAVRLSPYNDYIDCIGFVTDIEKANLYTNAHAFVSCSEFEGYGLPIIEAMQASCPIIAYNNSSIPEVVGRSDALIDTNDYVGIAKKIIELFDTKKREKYINEGLKRATKFSWNKYINQFIKAINS